VGFSAHGLPRRPQFPPAESLPGAGRKHGLAYQAGDVWARPGLPLKLARLAHQDHWIDEWVFSYDGQYVTGWIMGLRRRVNGRRTV